ncbi:MAG TPA: LuxR C-terminal-related transcriptional regulator, partial [Thermomicrobiales bacterium]|nr:LuxR C-terminal-related transcriptional regulator [Thermomicrobiales bacterium]
AARRGRRLDQMAMTVLAASALLASGDDIVAIAMFRRALELGQAEEIVRPIIDDGRTLLPFLRRDAFTGDFAAPYLARLTSAAGLSQPASDGMSGRANVPGGVKVASDPRTLESRIASLSARERQILAGIVDGLSNKEISKRLFIAEPTVRRHLTNAYAKLGVRNRMQAVVLIRTTQAFPRG